jgi:hypothetical protein
MHNGKNKWFYNTKGKNEIIGWRFRLSLEPCSGHLWFGRSTKAGRTKKGRSLVVVEVPSGVKGQVQRRGEERGVGIVVG